MKSFVLLYENLLFSVFLREEFCDVFDAGPRFFAGRDNSAGRQHEARTHRVWPALQGVRVLDAGLHLGPVVSATGSLVQNVRWRSNLPALVVNSHQAFGSFIGYSHKFFMIFGIFGGVSPRCKP